MQAGFFMELLYTLGIMTALAAVFALLASRFKQPLLLGYVLAGLLLGPAATGIIDDPMAILSFFAEFGLILLLFIIGLELDLTKIKSLGKMSVIIGAAQVALITGLVWGIGVLLGFGTIHSLYCGLVVAFSSTIVVVKLLSEKKELDTEHGNMVLGILIVEDILAVVGLTLLGVLVDSGETHHMIPTLMDAVRFLNVPLPHAAWFSLVELIINGVLFVITAYAFAKYALPKVMDLATGSTELLFGVSLALALVLASIGGFFGFSLAIGAFVAGIILSSSSNRHEMMGKAKPIRDFMLVLFFVALGTLLTLNNISEQIKLVVFLLAATLLLKPIIIFLVRKVFRYNNRISFLVSAALAQISEFSLILAMAGVAQGTLSPEFMTGAVIATLLSMMLTAYIIKYDEQLYTFFKPFIAPLEKLFGVREGEHHHTHERFKPEIVIFGVNAVSAESIEMLANRNILIIEKNPKKTISYRERGINTLCADVYNIDIYEELVDFSELKTAVSVIGDNAANIFLLKKLKHAKKEALVIATASTEDHGKKLYKHGASLVIIPDVTSRRLLAELLGGEQEELRNTGRMYAKSLDKHFVYLRE